MRASPSRIATTIIVGLLVAACAPTTSPSPDTPKVTPPATSPATSPPATSPPAFVSLTPGRIAAGSQHTCVLTSGGGVKCWGSNQSGELGNSTTPGTAVRGVVDVPGLPSGVTAITAGGSHSCALTSAGGVTCWGSNEYGQLGDGSTAGSSVPVDVVGLASGVRAIAAGWSDTCALTTDGGVKCWGNNPFGGLGDGTTKDSSVPVDVVGLESGVTAISAGTLHTCALTSGGGVSCWGYGQSDDSTLFTSAVPVQVPGLASGVTAIEATLDRTCALSRGGVMCWGPNYAPPPGETLPDRFVPIDVSRLSGEVIAIAPGERHTCVLTNRGGVACWGDNSHGQLGHFRSPSEAVPVEAPGFANGVTGIAVGGMHTCALSAGGGVRCWGFNDQGQLGSVLRCSSSSLPVDVPLDGNLVPLASSEPTVIPIGRIEHATGPTDVVLRFDRGPDFAVGDLVGELFQPGPEFTLYGDGTVIFRNEGAPPPPAEGPILRGRPFLIAHLDDDQVQALLRVALAAGGLGDACERYETQDTDVAGSDVWTIRAGDLDKRVVDVGSGPFAALKDDLRNFDQSGIPATVWVPDRFWGNLLEATSAIEQGLLPDLRDAGSVPWPWPAIVPADFAGRDEGGWIGQPRRVMSADGAAVLGLSANGGVVKRIYLVGPDRKTTYSFSLWPMLPDEPG